MNLNKIEPAHPRAVSDSIRIELSVVIPCLDEADTIGVCVAKALETMETLGVTGEVVVADNGSVDGSQNLATQAGARVVDVPIRGYGSALMHGIADARGEFVIMGDADDSYDFHEIGVFLEKLRDGFDLVQGCRFPSGGGRIEQGAMPFLHQWFGNPLLSALARLMFNVPVKDIYCGLRGFTKDLYLKLDQRCLGMEFATEMMIKSTLYGANIAEVPITLHPDGREKRGPHLRTFRDGWRTLRTFMLYSPRWTFAIPGIVLMFMGLIGYALSLPSLTIGGATFGAHTLLASTMFIFVGYQTLLFSLFTKMFAAAEGLLPQDPRVERLCEIITLERGLVLGAIVMVLGLVMILFVLLEWIELGFGSLNYPDTLRHVVPGVMLSVIGFQTILASFFVNILGMQRRK
jgi:glycosyltransferase involved in cell wall biosynthesis